MSRASSHMAHEDVGRQVIVRMPAKINLHLGIYPGHDARGYHRADSIMLAVGLFEELHAVEADDLRVSYKPGVLVPAERTATWRAVATLAALHGTDPRLRVTITRAIPSQGGMGSASADAAAALVACCALWGIDPRSDMVRDVAHGIGADVAFFLDPRPTLLGGVGDKPIEAFPTLRAPVALVMPVGCEVSTKAAYDEFDRMPVAPTSPKAMCRALGMQDLLGVSAALYNNLADAAMRLAPPIDELLDWVRRRDGVLGAQVTGSGGCVFALCGTDAAAGDIATAAHRRGWWACATHTVGASAVETIVV